MAIAGRKHQCICISVLLLGYALSLVKAVGPWCFACNDVAHPAICQFVVQCGEHESCSTKKVASHNGGEFFTTSCKDTKLCQSNVRTSSRVTKCDECCKGTLCNEAGCSSTGLRASGRLYCLKCDFVKNPAYCDQVEVCSADHFCSVSLQKKFGFEYYELGCRSKTSCPPQSATIAKDKSICCDSDLCNSNDLGVNLLLYTTTPIPTTRKPAIPQVSFDQTHIVYNITHAPNETLQLLCHVTGGPTPAVEWTYDNGTAKTPVKSGVSVEANGDSLLSVQLPQKSDAGKYICKATNNLGTDEKTIEVTVTEPPAITGKLNNSVVLQYQEDYTLECDVATNNSTNISWIIPHEVKSYTIHPNNSLTIYNVHSENAGAYVCVAENADGKTVKTFSIGVNDTTTVTSPQPCTCPTVTTATSKGPVVSQPTSQPTCPPVTCPTVTTQPCPTVTVTPCPTSSTNQMTSSTTLTTNTVQSQAFSKIPATSTTRPTTSSSPTTSPTTSSTPTTQMPQINTLPTANSSPPNIFPTNPTATHPVNDQFQSEKRYLNILQCPVTPANKGDVTWHRLVHDFDRTNPAYIDSGFGVLTISNQMSVLSTGVYECRLKNTSVAQFVIYEELSNTAKCYDVFGSATTTKGVVIRAKCGACVNPLGIRPMIPLKVTDYICESAIATQLIKAYGGDVTYLIKSPTEVVLLKENNGGTLIQFP